MSDDLVNRLKDAHANATQRILGSSIFGDAATALTEARAEIERLREWKQNQLVHWPMEIERRNRELAAVESELSTLRARVREVVGPFARADAAIGSTPGPFRFETGTGYRLIEREDLSAARQLMEEVK